MSTQQPQLPEPPADDATGEDVAAYHDQVDRYVNAICAPEPPADDATCEEFAAYLDQVDEYVQAVCTPAELERRLKAVLRAAGYASN